MTRCTPECGTPTSVQAHCSVCHRTFGSAGGFDRHRIPIEGRRRGMREAAAAGPLKRCLDPADIAMAERGGVWRRVLSDADRERLYGESK